MCFDFMQAICIERSAATSLPLTGNFLAPSPSRLCVSPIPHAALALLALPIDAGRKAACRHASKLCGAELHPLIYAAKALEPAPARFHAINEISEK